MRAEIQYEGPEMTGSEERDFVNRLLVFASATHARETEQDLYFIEVQDELAPAGPIKIGVAKNVHHRLSALQTACPYRLVLRRSIARMGLVERYLHSVLRPHRTYGEWFEPAPLVVAAADGHLPASALLERPSLDGRTAWADVDGRLAGRMVMEVWSYAGLNRMWADSQRLVRSRLGHGRTIGEAYDLAVKADIEFGVGAA